MAALVTASPDSFWPPLWPLLAGTIGGAISWWMGLATKPGLEQRPKLRRHGEGRPNMHHHQSRWNRLARYWLRKYGAKVCLLAGCLSSATRYAVAPARCALPSGLRRLYGSCQNSCAIR